MQVNLDKLTVAALEGKTELTALLDWQQAISWRGELKLTGINTAKEVPDWPSKLDGLIKTRGSLYGGTADGRAGTQAHRQREAEQSQRRGLA